MYTRAPSRGKPNDIKTELPDSTPLEPERARAGEPQCIGSSGNFPDRTAAVNAAAEFAERAAIAEFDGGLPRDEAEYLAAREIYDSLGVAP